MMARHRILKCSLRLVLPAATLVAAFAMFGAGCGGGPPASQPDVSLSSTTVTSVTATSPSASGQTTSFADPTSTSGQTPPPLLLSYPSDFLPPQTGGGVTPNEEYYLRLRADGIEKEIRWDDTSLSADPQAVALREWFEWLEAVVSAKPEYKTLPEFRGRYA